MAKRTSTVLCNRILKNVAEHFPCCISNICVVSEDVLPVFVSPVVNTSIIRGVQNPPNCTEKLFKKKQHQIQIYQNPKTAVTNVKVAIIVPVHLPMSYT